MGLGRDKIQEILLSSETDSNAGVLNLLTRKAPPVRNIKPADESIDLEILSKPLPKQKQVPKPLLTSGSQEPDQHSITPKRLSLPVEPIETSSRFEIFLTRVVPRFLTKVAQEKPVSSKERLKSNAEKKELVQQEKLIKSQAGAIRLRLNGQFQFVSPQDLKFLPENIRAHVLAYGIRFTQFPEGYVRNVRTADLINRLQLLFDAMEKLIGSSNSSNLPDFKTVFDKILEYVKKNFDIDAIVNDKTLTASARLKKLKKVYQDFKLYLQGELAPGITKVVLSRLEKKPQQQEAFATTIENNISTHVDALKELFKTELDILAEKGRPLIINIDPDGETISGEVGIATDKEGNPVILGCYDRNNPEIAANTLFRFNAHIETNSLGNKYLKLDSTGFRSANFAPTNKVNATEIVAETVTHLEQFFRDVAVTTLSDKPQEDKEAGSIENPLVIKISTQSLLSMLAPELEKIADNQRQREQVMAVFHACQILTAKGIAQPYALTIKGRTVYVRPDIELEVTPINTGRYATTADIESDEALPNYFISNFLTKDQLAPKQAEFVRVHALNNLLGEIPSLLNSKINPRIARNVYVRELKNLFDWIFQEDEALIEAKKTVRDHKQKIETLYANLDLQAPDAAKLSEIESEQLEHLKLEQALVDIYSERFLELQRQNRFETALNSLYEQSTNHLFRQPEVVAFYNLAQRVYALLDLNFTKTEQTISLTVPTVKIDVPIKVRARKALDPEYIGFLPVIVAELNSERKRIGNVKCFDGNDRTGKVIQEQQDHQVFQRRNRNFVAAHYKEADRETLTKIHEQRQYTDASLYTTKLTAGAIGKQIHHRDGATYASKELNLNRTSLAKIFPQVHERINPNVHNSSGFLKKFLLAVSLFLGLATAGTAGTSPTPSNLPQVASSGTVVVSNPVNPIEKIQTLGEGQVESANSRDQLSTKPSENGNLNPQRNNDDTFSSIGQGSTGGQKGANGLERLGGGDSSGPIAAATGTPANDKPTSPSPKDEIAPGKSFEEMTNLERVKTLGLGGKSGKAQKDYEGLTKKTTSEENPKTLGRKFSLSSFIASEHEENTRDLDSLMSDNSHPSSSPISPRFTLSH